MDSDLEIIEIEPPTASLKSLNEDANFVEASSLEPCGSNSNDLHCVPIPKLIINKTYLFTYQKKNDQDEEVLKKCGVANCYIPLENIEQALINDKKEQLRKQFRDKRRRERLVREERKTRNKNRKRSKSCSPTEIHKPIEKQVYALCCSCTKVINMTAGLETIYCSSECIQTKVDNIKKSIKCIEQLTIVDAKGSIPTLIKKPTIEDLLQFIKDNPKYQPMVNTRAVFIPQKTHLSAEQLKKFESLRNDTRKLIARKLENRSKAENMNFTPKRYKELSAGIEHELFDAHGESELKYKKWLRLFISVVDDEKNGYFRGILREKVSFKKLVTLSANDMRDPIVPVLKTKPNVPALPSNQPISSQESPPDADVVADIIPFNSDPLNFLENFDKKFSKPAASFVDSNSDKKWSRNEKSMNAHQSIIDYLLDNKRNTTAQHLSHLYDANCYICRNKTIKEAKEKERIESPQTRQQEKPKPSFPNLVRKSSLSNAADENRDDRGDVGDCIEICSADTISSTALRKLEKTDFWKQASKTVWDGVLTMGADICFPCKLNAILNSQSFVLCKEMLSLVRVVGLIEASNVWSYIRCMLKQKLSKQISVLHMETSANDYIKQFVALYKKFERNSRFGILDFSQRNVGDTNLREGFIFAIGPAEGLPEELTNLNLDGPGLPESALIQAIIVVILIQKLDCKMYDVANALNEKKALLKDENREPSLDLVPREKSSSKSSISVASIPLDSALLEVDDPRFAAFQANPNSVYATKYWQMRNQNQS